MKEIIELLRKHSSIGLLGNRSTAKTSLVLNLFRDIRLQNKDVKLAVMGVNPELKPILDKYNITMLISRMDILDLRLRDTILFIDEMALFFDTKSQTKQLDKLQRFFDRLEHNNCKIICGTAREGYFNKFMCSRITAFLTKQIEYESLVNGTWIKERIKAITSVSDYRLEAGKSEYFIVSSDSTTTKHQFRYSAEFDTKKYNKTLL